MQYDPLRLYSRSIHYIEPSYLDQDAATIEQLRLNWQQLRAMRQQTITVEIVSGSSSVDESKCVEGSISEVRDAR